MSSSLACLGTMLLGFSEELMQLTRHFADCETTDVVASDILSEPFVDNAFKVQAFCIPSDCDTSEPDLKRIKTDGNSCATTYAYYFQCMQPRFKLDKVKCMTLGVPKSIFQSKAIREVLDGQSITLPNGTIITPEQITTPAPLAPNFLLIDCPSAQFIGQIEKTKTILDAIQTATPGDQETSGVHPGVSLIVHLLPPGLFGSEDYQSFLRRFTTSILDASKPIYPPAASETDCAVHETREPIQHLILDGTGCIPSVSGIYSQSTILNQFFDKSVYPLLHDQQSAEMKQKIADAIGNCPAAFDTIVNGQPRMQYSIRPWIGFANLECESLDEEQFLNDAFDPLYVSREEADIEFSVMRDKLSQHTTSSENESSALMRTDEFPEITFLGTASSSPNKYRNISCILLQLSPDDYIMLDCGEGSLNQLYALHGRKGCEAILRRLRLILVTHMHADHHGGVFSVALARSRLLQLDRAIDCPTSPMTTEADGNNHSRLPVLAPPAFTRWMTSFSQLFPLHGPTIQLSVIPYLFQSPYPPNHWPPTCPIRMDCPLLPDWQALMERLKIEVQPIKVPHTGTSWAFKILGHPTSDSTSPSNEWSLVYSGDTPECPDLIEAGRNCTLLIHEATMVDEHADLAVRAKHSTLSSAIRAGEAMQAEFTILNHFSQRYGRVPVLDTFKPNVAISLDFMKVKFSDLWRLPYYVPYYKYAFAKHWDAHQVRVDAYSWRKYREREQQGGDDAAAAAEERPQTVKETQRLAGH